MELKSFITTHQFSGHGQEGDPFIITGLNITANSSYALQLHHLTSYIVIKDSIFQQGTRGGIAIEKSSHIVIENSEIRDNQGDGLLVKHSRDIRITNNRISGTTALSRTTDSEGLIDFPFSMDITRSTKIFITNNYLEDNYDGIWLWNGVNSSVIRNNTITNHYYEGIGTGRELSGGRSFNNTIEQNHIEHTRYGIWVWNEDENTAIVDNVINATKNGIRVEGGQKLSITGNEIRHSDNSGMYIGKSPIQLSIGITLKHNTLSENSGFAIEGMVNNFNASYNSFIDNHLGSDPFQLSGNDIHFSYNYYSDWTTPDKNGDHIVDTPYHVGTGIIDEYPLTQPGQVPLSQTTKTPMMMTVSMLGLGIMLITRKRNQYL